MNYLKIRNEINRVKSYFSLKLNSEKISYLADGEIKTKLSIVRTLSYPSHATLRRRNLIALILPNNDVALGSGKVRYLNGELSIHNEVLSFGIDVTVNIAIAYFMGDPICLN